VPYYQEPAAETPHIYVAQPPLPPTPPRNRYYHDGFYLRLAAGYGYLATSTSLNNNGSTASTSGSGAAFDLMIGGTPAPGLVVGGALQLQAAFDPGSTVTQAGDVHVSGLDSGASGSVGFGMIGPMIDAFPIPTGGFHLGGTLGLAEVGLRSNQNNLSGGFGAGIWTGYMWWASSQWSMGLMARFSLAFTGRKVGVDAEQFDASDLSTALGIMLSAAYH
jgi:hypothetical protein